ncbi:MAG: cytochrome c3 family protein [Thermodesulfobacteriota bacterium]
MLGTRIIIFLLLFSGIAAVGFSAENKGPREISLEGGTGGPVPFPHHRHQDAVGSCTICHDLFPQQVGGIQELKNRQKLASKDVMNKSCIKCHREKKTAGEKSGPLTCTTCHKKPG